MNELEILQELKKRINPNIWNSWFSTLKVLEFKDNKIILGVGNFFLLSRIEKKYMDMLRNYIVDITGKKNIEVELSFVPIDEKEKVAGPLIKERPLKLSEFNPEYTFQTFVIGESNRMAYYISLSVAKDPGRYNPLFIYGGVGLGKTHLLHAIGNYVMENTPNLKIMYLTAEEFMNEMIQAIKNNEMQEFREKFRKKVDILLIDDIQFLIGKERIQDELFHTFNALFNMNKQIVICSDRTPEELSTFHPRLISRFEMGIVEKIEEPDRKMKILIAKKIASKLGISLSDEVINFVVENSDSIRKIRGLILNLSVHIKHTGKVTVDTVKQLLLKYKGSSKGNVKVNDFTKSELKNKVMEAVQIEFGITIEQILKSRKREVSLARNILAYLLKTYSKLKVKEVAILLKRSHATISGAINNVEKKLIEGDVVVKRYITRIRKRLEMYDKFEKANVG